jgi:5-(carboxyamino)imidazole ribonucleotide mutase/phosphoribosylaminoimidazole-succinocarboxamide synthase
MNGASDRLPFAVIIMGSASDRAHCAEIASALEGLGVPNVQRIASAHKTPAHLLEILAGYEADSLSHVYITVAGRSNALSGFVDAAVRSPVIACPPTSTTFAGLDIISSLRMPSGVASLLVLEPGNAALAAAKILCLANPSLAERVAALQAENARSILDADEEMRIA